MYERWVAGDMSCGRLVVELGLRMKRLEPGAHLEIVANDPGASTEVPSWCRMTGHTLVTANHPIYVIRRKAK